MKLITVIFGTVVCAVLYHQVLGDGVTKCYTCELTDTKCENQTETICDETGEGDDNTTWACMTWSVSKDDILVINKLCAPKDAAIDTCIDFDEGLPDDVNSSCTVCIQDLCNSDNN